MQLCSINVIGIGIADAEKKNNLVKANTNPKSAVNTNASAIVNTNVAPQTNNVASMQQKTSTINTEILPPKDVVTAPVNTATVFKKPAIKTSTPSISQHLNSDKKKEQIKDNGREHNQSISGSANISFTQQALESVWDKYARDLKTKGKANLALALLSRRPFLVDGTAIEFTVNNKSLEESINEDKLNLLGFLRKELNNFAIQLNLLMTTSEEKTNLYTATDRYKHLAEKNPNINKLRQAYDLDIEF